MGLRLARVAQSRIKLGQGGFLPTVAKCTQGRIVACRLDPRCGDGDDLLMKTCGIRTVQGETAEKNDTGLRGLAGDDAHPLKPGLKSLSEEPGQQAPDQSVLEVQLHDARGLGAIRQCRWAEGHGADRTGRTPLGNPLSATTAPVAQIVESIGPAGFIERWSCRVKFEQ